MLKKFSLPFLGFLQATGLILYIIAVACFFNLVMPHFNKFEADYAEFYAPIIMLLVFVLSAVISASLVLGRAGILFWDKKYKESFTLIGWTVFWGIIYLLLVLLILAVI